MTSAAFTKPARSWTRLDGIDLLRGLAIFFVLMNHVNMELLGAKVPYTKGLPAQLVYSLVWNGQSEPPNRSEMFVLLWSSGVKCNSRAKPPQWSKKAALLLRTVLKRPSGEVAETPFAGSSSVFVQSDIHLD